MPGDCPAAVENSFCHGAGEAGVECEAAMLGKESKWCSAGEEMAESVSIRDEMTSADAGLTSTRFDCRRRPSWCVDPDNERRLLSSLDSFSSFDLGLDEVFADVLMGMRGPLGEANMMESRCRSVARAREDQHVVSCKHGLVLKVWDRSWVRHFH